MYFYNLTTSNLHYEKFQDGSVKQIDVPYEIPESWGWVKLNNIIKLTSGRDLPKEKYSDKEIRTYPYITGASNFSNFKIMTNRYTDDNSVLSYRGDILITVKGTIGELAFNPFKEAYIARQVMAISGVQIYSDYLFFYLQNSISILKNKGQSLIPGISRETILNLFIPIPPLKEQKRIIEILFEAIPKFEEYSFCYHELKKLNSEFPDKLRKSILQYAMQGKLVPQDETDESVEVLLERIKEEKQRLFEEGKLKKKDLQESIIYQGDDNSYYENKFPKNWIITTLCNMGDISTGNTPSKNNYSYWINGTIPFFKPADLVQKKNMHTASEYLSVEGFKKARYVEKDSILVNGIGNIGVTGMVKKEGAFNQQMHSVKPYNYIDSDFLFYLFNTNFVQEQMINNSSSTTIPILNKKKFSELIGVFPSLQEQKRIVSRIEKINFLIKKI